jgi:hypothetical protein
MSSYVYQCDYFKITLLSPLVPDVIQMSVWTTHFVNFDLRLVFSGVCVNWSLGLYVMFLDRCWSSPLILVNTISSDVSIFTLGFIFFFSQELWSAEFSSCEKWLVKSIFREPWWEPCLSFIFRSQLYIFVRFQIFIFSPIIWIYLHFISKWLIFIQLLFHVNE